MKILKTLLVLSVATGALSAQAKDGKTYVRGQLGGSQALKYEKSPSMVHSGDFSRSKNFGVYGGIGLEHFQTLHNKNSRLVLGAGLDANMESTKAKQSSTSGSTTTYEEIKRKYVINALAHLGWKLSRDVRPYVVAGASYAHFNFSNTTKTGSAITASGKSKQVIGWAGGLGMSFGLSRKWITDIRYLYTSYGTVKSTGIATSKAPNAYHAVTVGVSYKL